MTHANLLEETVTVATTASDAELIATARSLNASVQFYLRKSTEEFWKLGEILTRLQERPSARGRWRKILDEIGINRQSDNHARRLFAATSLDSLAKYRNKTEALRDLGILAEPSSARKETSDRGLEPKKEPASGAAGATEPHEGEPAGSVGSGQVAAPIADAAGATTGEGHAEEGAAGENITGPESVATNDPLEKLTRIAGRLEYLTEEEFEFSPEVFAQIERAAKALDLLRRKGAARAAA